MSSSEDDYMSETFITGCVENDVRPGLIYNQTLKRNHELFKKKSKTDNINKSGNRPKGVLESESRELKLNEPISTDNKGFAILQKLGFKPGSGLGKSSAGRTEPIPIKLKSDRQGLGREEAMRQRRTEVAAARKAAHDKLTNVDDYRSHLAGKTTEKRAYIDLRKSQRICQRLDQDEGIEEPDETWYWPEVVLKKESAKEDDDDDCDVRNESKKLTGYNAECNDDIEDVEDSEQEAVDDTEEYTITEKLEMLTYYLRSKHRYCIWCAIRFEDSDDLRQECPGPTYQDH